jgi:hypothetical protein
MLAANQGRADAFDLSADPESSDITTSNVPRLRNLAGYLPHGWIELGSQLRSACGLLAALLGPYLCVSLPPLFDQVWPSADSAQPGAGP